MEDKQQTIFNFGFNETSKEHIRGIGQWGKINAVLSLVMLALNVVQFIMASGSAYRTSGFNFRMNADNPTSLVVQVALSLLLNITLYTASVKMKRAIDDMNRGLMNNSLNGLRNYYKIYGIIVIIALILGTLAILFVSTFSRN